MLALAVASDVSQVRRCDGAAQLMAQLNSDRDESHFSRLPSARISGRACPPVPGLAGRDEERGGAGGAAALTWRTIRCGTVPFCSIYQRPALQHQFITPASSAAALTGDSEQLHQRVPIVLPIHQCFCVTVLATVLMTIT